MTLGGLQQSRMNEEVRHSNLASGVKIVEFSLILTKYFIHLRRTKKVETLVVNSPTYNYCNNDICRIEIWNEGCC